MGMQGGVKWLDYMFIQLNWLVFVISSQRLFVLTSCWVSYRIIWVQVMDAEVRPLIHRFVPHLLLHEDEVFVMHMNTYKQVKNYYEQGKLPLEALRIYMNLFMESRLRERRHFELCNSELIKLSGLTRSQLFRYRPRLIECGFIEAQTAQGSSRVLYTITGGMQWTS